MRPCGTNIGAELEGDEAVDDRSPKRGVGVHPGVVGERVEPVGREDDRRRRPLGDLGEGAPMGVEVERGTGVVVHEGAGRRSRRGPRTPAATSRTWARVAASSSWT